MQLLTRLEKIEDERRFILEHTRQDAAGQLEALQEEVAQVRRELARARQPVEPLREVVEKIEALEERVEQPVQQIETPELRQVRQMRRPIRVGDKVRLRNLGAQGMVTALSDEEAEVQVGVLRVRTRIGDILHASDVQPDAQTAVEGSRLRQAKSEAASESAKQTEGKTAETGTTARGEAGLAASPGFELDLRGRRADDALDALERYLDTAFIAGLPFVRIIHGKGTGRLREVVRQALAQSEHVRSYESGGDKEGGEGVTVAKLSQ